MYRGSAILHKDNMIVCLRGFANLSPDIRTDLQIRTGCNRLSLAIARADGPNVSNKLTFCFV